MVCLTPVGAPTCAAVGQFIVDAVTVVIGIAIVVEIAEQPKTEEPNKSEPGTPESDDGCIYECDGVSEGQETESGRPYIGRTGDKKKRAKNARDGRNRKNAKTVGKYKKGDPTDAQNAEQSAMNEKGGKGKLDNKRDEVRKDKWKERSIKPPRNQ